MNAQVFYLKEHEKASRKLLALLRKHLYDGIGVEELAFGDRNSGASQWGDVYGLDQRYINALKASAVRPDAFRVLVEWGDGSYWYLGYGYSGMAQDLKLSGEMIASLFPAVAVMGRMAIAPEGVQELMKNSPEFKSLLKPLDLQGVQLVDFSDQKSVEVGVRRVSAQIKAEVVKLCQRYMQMKKIAKPDFDGMARTLGVDEEFLEQLEDKILAPWVRLTPSIVGGAVPAGKASLVTLEVKNESENAFGVVRVKVTGPADTLAEPVVKYLDFSAGPDQPQEAGPGQTKQIQFLATPATPPCCPFWVEFEPDETVQTYTPVLNAVLLDVVEA